MDLTDLSCLKEFPPKAICKVIKKTEGIDVLTEFWNEVERVRRCVGPFGVYGHCDTEGLDLVTSALHARITTLRAEQTARVRLRAAELRSWHLSREQYENGKTTKDEKPAETANPDPTTKNTHSERTRRRTARRVTE